MIEQKIVVFFCAVAFVLSPTALGRKPASLTGVGPFKVLLRRFSNVSDDFTSSGKIWSKIHVSPYSSRQLQSVWGESYVGIDVDDNLKTEVKLASRVNHKWKKNSFALNLEHACTDMMHHSKQVSMILFGDEGARCPVKAGARPIKNHTVDLVFPEFKTFAYGRWLLTLVLKKEREVVGVFTVDAETLPKN